MNKTKIIEIAELLKLTIGSERKENEKDVRVEAIMDVAIILGIEDEVIAEYERITSEQ